MSMLGIPRIPTSDLLQKIGEAAQEKGQQVHIWSCYAGMAVEGVRYLPAGSMIILDNQVF